MSADRRRRRMRRSSPAAAAVGEPGTGVDVTSGAGPVTADEAPRSPTPQDLAERGGTFAMTAGVLDPEDEPEATRAPGDVNGRAEPGIGGPEWSGDAPAGPGRLADDPQAERGLRGLVGGGSSQVGVGAAMRARDAARPNEADLAAAEADLVIVRRGWVPREDLPPRGPRH